MISFKGEPMSSFQMFAPLLLGWYWIAAPPRAT
jgi:hypothetical protein